MTGLDDQDEVWRKLNKVSFISRVLRREDWSRESPRPRPTYRTAKEALLSEVAHVFLAEASAHRGSELLTYYMYGVHVCSGMLVVKNLGSYAQHTSLALGGGRSLTHHMWAVPKRFFHEAGSTRTAAKMLDRFLHRCRWYPTVVQLTENLRYLGRLNVYFDLLPRVEEVYISSNVPNSALLMTSLLQAVVKAAKRSLKSVALAGYSSDLYSLITVLFTTLHGDETEVHNGLLKLEVIVTPMEGCYFTRLSWAMENLVQLISHQLLMESLVIDNFVDLPSEQNIMGGWEVSHVSYKHFGFFYNFLPHFVSKPSFKSLRIIDCKVPSNSMESIIASFLSNASSHTQSLEFFGCCVLEKCLRTVPREFRLQKSEEFGLYQVAEKRCVSGEHKSLSVPVGEPLFPLGWLADYPGLHLKKLDLQFIFPEDEINQTAKFDATREALNLFGRSVDSACVTFLGGHQCQSTISTVLESPYLTELRLVNVGDDGILGAMTRAIARAQSLRKLSFEIVGTSDFGSKTPSETFTSFFAMLFSMPGEQLSNFVLELGTIGREKAAAIVQAWRSHAHLCQKLRAVTYTSKSSRHCSDLRKIAVEVQIHK